MKKLITSLLLLLGCLSVFSQDGFDPDKLLTPRTGKQQLVNDFAGVLTALQQQDLEAKLVRFDDSTSTQIAVVIVPTLGNYAIADYGVKLGRAWGVGGKDNNNGVVVLVSTKERKVNISTGYGVEGALPDVTCKHIIDELIVPGFRGSDYYGGLDRGTDAIMKAVKGEYAAPEGYNKRKKGTPVGAIIAFIIILIIISSISRGGGGGFMSRRGYRGFTGPFIFPGGGGGSSGWGGGGSSGGFGGFGGGSFGGGGASGDW